MRVKRTRGSPGCVIGASLECASLECASHKKNWFVRLQAEAWTINNGVNSMEHGAFLF